MYIDIDCIKGPFSDTAAANALIRDIEAECDEDCMKKGSRWSVLFFVDGLVMFGYSVGFVCMICAMKVPVVRLATSACACCMCLTQFGTIITIGVFRFNSWGLLCSLSERRNMYIDG